MFFHLTKRKLRSMKKAGRIDCGDRGILSFGIFGERLRDEDAGVIDQRVDAAKPGNAFEYRALSGGTLTYVAPHRNNLIIVVWLDCSRNRDNPVVAIAIRLDQR